MPPGIDPVVQVQIESLIREGRKIQAIKQYREIMGVGLKEAKDAVERYEKELMKRSPEQLDTPPDPTKPIGPAGCSGVLLGMFVVILLIISLVAKAL